MANQQNKDRNKLQDSRSNQQFSKEETKPVAQAVGKESLELIRLNKFIANAGVCSRRDADKLIESGLIKVNGKTITDLGTKIILTDKVIYENRILQIEKKFYVLLNKPKGYITTTDDPHDRKTVMFLTQKACKERM